MNKKEFESRTGKAVSDEQYKEIEQVYMAAGDNVDKDVFCAMYRNKDFDLCIALAEQVERMKAMYEAQTNNLNLLSRKVLAVTNSIHEVCKEECDHLELAVSMVINTREYLKIKLEHNYYLDEDDRKHLIDYMYE